MTQEQFFYFADFAFGVYDGSWAMLRPYLLNGQWFPI